MAVTFPQNITFTDSVFADYRQLCETKDDMLGLNVPIGFEVYRSDVGMWYIQTEAGWEPRNNQNIGTWQ